MRALLLVPLCACVADATLVAPPEPDAAERDARQGADDARLRVDLARAAIGAGCDATHAVARGEAWFTDLQAALDDVGAGRTVLVCPGVWSQARVAEGDELTVASLDPSQPATLSGLSAQWADALTLVDLDLRGVHHLDAGPPPTRPASGGVGTVRVIDSALRADGHLDLDAEEVVLVGVDVRGTNGRTSPIAVGASRIVVLDSAFVGNVSAQGAGGLSVHPRSVDRWTADGHERGPSFTLSVGNRFEGNLGASGAFTVASRGASALWSRSDTFVGNIGDLSGAMHLDLQPDAPGEDERSEVDVRFATFTRNTATGEGAALRLWASDDDDGHDSVRITLHAIQVEAQVGGGPALSFLTGTRLPDASLVVEGGEIARNQTQGALSFDDGWSVTGTGVTFGEGADANQGDDLPHCGSGLGLMPYFASEAGEVESFCR